MLGSEGAAGKIKVLTAADRVVLANAAFPLNDIERGFVELANGRVARLGAGQPSGLDTGAMVIDCSNQFVLPGLIDAHVHLNGEMWKDPYRRFVSPRNTARAIRAAAAAQVVLAAGFTTVRALGHGHADITYGLRECIEAGTCYGPHVLTSGWAISQSGGHGHLHTSPYEDIWPYELVEERRPRSAFADGPIELRKMVRTNFGDGADLIKIYVTEGSITTPSKYRNKLNFTMEEIRTVADEAHLRGAKVAAHSTTAEGTRRAVEAGVDTIEHGPRGSDPELAALMAERGAYLVPTLSVVERALHQRVELALSDELMAVVEREWEGNVAFVQDAIRSGVKIVTGTDSSSLPDLGNCARELELLAAAGMSNRETLGAATHVAAEALGLAGQIGELREGALADCIVLRRNPLEDIRILQDHTSNVARVFRSASGFSQ